MEGIFDRTYLLLGNEAMDRLLSARIAVFGIGGVGGHVCEALARTGVGALDLIDNDTVSLSNINRQIIATHSSLGRLKTEVMRDRITDINPACQVTTYNCFVLPDNVNLFPFEDYDYVVDAVDTVSAKLAIIEQAVKCGVPVISSMGAGNKLDGSRFQIIDLFRTTMDPLAKVMRRELRKRGISSLKVVWSDEAPITPRTGEVPLTRQAANVPISPQTSEAPIQAGEMPVSLQTGEAPIQADEMPVSLQTGEAPIQADEMPVSLQTGEAPIQTGESSISPQTKEAPSPDAPQPPHRAVDHASINDASRNECAKPARRRSTPGSVAFVPSIAGLLLAGAVIQDLNRVECLRHPTR